MVRKKLLYVKTEDIRSKPFDNHMILNHPEFLVETDPELILVSGGDGAMIHAIQALNSLKAPFFGRAKGTLNLLMNDFNDDIKVLELLIDNKLDLHFIETTSIKVEQQNQNGVKNLLGFAVNEVVIGSNLMGYHHFEISSEDQTFTNFNIKGSGICIATDLGSTGYNFNLGGPVLPMGSDLWVLKGIVCNDYLDDILKVQKITIDFVSDREKGGVFLDGIRVKNLETKESLEIDYTDKIILTKGEKIQIAFLDKHTFLSKRAQIASRHRNN